jgi:hypothetical protein
MSLLAEPSLAEALRRAARVAARSTGCLAPRMAHRDVAG